METSEKRKLLTALKKGTVTVTFQKINTGELRVMPCTLNPVVLEANEAPINFNKISADDMEELIKTTPFWKSLELEELSDKNRVPINQLKNEYEKD